MYTRILTCIPSFPTPSTRSSIFARFIHQTPPYRRGRNLLEAYQQVLKPVTTSSFFVPDILPSNQDIPTDGAAELGPAFSRAVPPTSTTDGLVIQPGPNDFPPAELMKLPPFAITSRDPSASHATVVRGVSIPPKPRAPGEEGMSTESIVFHLRYKKHCPLCLLPSYNCWNSR
jgi:hypothetical protein